jgi:hypothetical protein
MNSNTCPASSMFRSTTVQCTCMIYSEYSSIVPVVTNRYGQTRIFDQVAVQLYSTTISTYAYKYKFYVTRFVVSAKPVFWSPRTCTNRVLVLVCIPRIVPTGSSCTLVAVYGRRSHSTKLSSDSMSVTRHNVVSKKPFLQNCLMYFTEIRSCTHIVDKIFFTPTISVVRKILKVQALNLVPLTNCKNRSR